MVFDYAKARIAGTYSVTLPTGLYEALCARTGATCKVMTNPPEATAHAPGRPALGPAEPPVPDVAQKLAPGARRNGGAGAGQASTEEKPEAIEP